MNGIIREEENFCLLLSTTVYSVEAIKKTAYKFADRASVVLQPAGEATLKVVFNFTGRHTPNPEQVISDFCNELLDQDLREIVKRETGPLRNVILAHAFSRTQLAEQS